MIETLPLWRTYSRLVLAAQKVCAVLRRMCANCERCTWNPGPDCGRPDHEHCSKCGHCRGRHHR